MKTLTTTIDPEDFLREEIAKGLLELLRVRSRWHPLWRVAFNALDETERRCPFAYEHSRGPDDLAPCASRYVDLCGCHQTGVPAARDHWKRHQ